MTALQRIERGTELLFAYDKGGQGGYWKRWGKRRKTRARAMVGELTREREQAAPPSSPPPPPPQHIPVAAASSGAASLGAASSGGASSTAKASANSNKRPRSTPHNSLWVDANKTEMASVPPESSRLPHCIARPYLSTKRTYMRITQHIHFTCYFISAQASQSCAIIQHFAFRLFTNHQERSQHHFCRLTRHGSTRHGKQKQGL